ncbi:MAG: hypothetical protein JWM07_930 [Candidatus Saccharibacteria bacterium]|nr:hypothetical protein [Candidatus Saccharibacteria bacterium]
MSEFAVYSGASAEGEMPISFDKLAAYYAWQNRNRAAELAEREKWVKNPGYNKSLQVPSYQPWEAPGLEGEERKKIYAEIKLNEFYELNDGFSPAAHAVVHSADSAKFFDDVKCDYLGDSDHLGWFKEISPSLNDTPFDVQFDYDVGKINHYTENGMIVHVRETSDPAAKTREQKLFIVLANLMTGELNRVFAHDHDDEKGHLAPGFEHSLDETIHLKSRHLSSVNGLKDIAAKNSFAPKYHDEIDHLLKQRQPKIQFHRTGARSFKPEGYVGYEVLRPIARLDVERHLLGVLALQAGQQLNDRGAIEHTPDRLSIAQ